MAREHILKLYDEELTRLSDKVIFCFDGDRAGRD